MQVARKIAEVRDATALARAEGATIGLVPTMGFLHEGHLSLVDRCSELADFVVMSIYVNPLQFGPQDDFEEYPRDLQRDLALAEQRGVDLTFTPDDRELYPEPLTVAVTPRRLSDRLCGLSRRGHFDGVLTVVAKLFGIIQPDVSVFGQKDFQQAVLIRRMVADLSLPVRVEVAPTVREPDGLAMSSRNGYLSSEERETARILPRALADSVVAYRAGERDVGALRKGILEALETRDGIGVEYVEIVSGEGLEPLENADESAVVALAAQVGSTRLIDNVWLARPDPGIEGMLEARDG